MNGCEHCSALIMSYCSRKYLVYYVTDIQKRMRTHKGSTKTFMSTFLSTHDMLRHYIIQYTIFREDPCLVDYMLKITTYLTLFKNITTCPEKNVGSTRPYDIIL